MDRKSQISLSSSDVVSVGLKIDKDLVLYKINQRESLSRVIEDICKDYNLDDDDKYCLQFDNHATYGFRYITEDNRYAISNGSVCKLVYSPKHLVNSILAKMVSPDSDMNAWSFQKLLALMDDSAFLTVFIEAKGIMVLVTLIQGNALSNESSELAFTCLSRLLEKGLIDLDKVKDRILDKVFQSILTKGLANSLIVVPSLSITCTLLDKYHAIFPEVYETVTIERVMPHLKSDNVVVLENALCLINSIFSAANALQRKILLKKHAKWIRDVVYRQYIIHNTSNASETMTRHLSSFQALLVGRLRRKVECPADLQDNVVKSRLLSIKLLFEESSSDKTLSSPSEIGFLHQQPPTLLVLDCMTYFARTYRQRYTMTVYEHTIRMTAKHTSMEFFRQLTLILAEALGILHVPTDNDDLPYHPILFASDHIFEELFCTCILAVNKTSQEMRATDEDFSKVMAVVGKKLEMALKSNPIGIKEFGEQLFAISYSEVSKARQEEDLRRETVRMQNNASVEQRRQERNVEFVDLVRKQRVKVLTEGIAFQKFNVKGSRIKNRLWLVKYVPNQRKFEFSDKDEKFNNFSIELDKIKNIVTGLDCSHVKIRNSKLKPEFGFSLILNEMEPNYINLAATCERDLHVILDGLCTLHGKPMKSSSCDQDIAQLTEIQLRLDLLDAYGIELPAGDPPPVPSDPLNYNFLPARATSRRY